MERDTQNQNYKEKALRWQFWFLISFSLLLLVTFVFYLPTRFLYHAGVLPGHIDARDDAMTEMHEDAHGEALTHEEANVREGLAVNLNVAPVPFAAGQNQKLSFFVNEKPGNSAVSARELEIEHEKIMHVIGVRSDMNEFFHIHPESTTTPGILTVDYVFQKPGRYKIWSEIKKDGTSHSYGHPELNVEGEGLREEKQITFARNRIAGNYQVSLDADEPVVKGHEHELIFDIHSLTGGDVLLEDYLGAQMHLTIIKDDWKQFIHTHPEGGEHGHASFGLVKRAMANGGEHAEPAGDVHGVVFHATFPEAGLYKAFGQFKPADAGLGPDEALTVEFWIRVENNAPFPISPWWLLLISSLILMSILGWMVNRYINPAQNK